MKRIMKVQYIEISSCSFLFLNTYVNDTRSFEKYVNTINNSKINFPKTNKTLATHIQDFSKHTSQHCQKNLSMQLRRGY